MSKSHEICLEGVSRTAGSIASGNTLVWEVTGLLILYSSETLERKCNVNGKNCYREGGCLRSPPAGHSGASRASPLSSAFVFLKKELGSYADSWLVAIDEHHKQTDHTAC